MVCAACSGLRLFLADYAFWWRYSEFEKRAGKPRHRFPRHVSPRRASRKRRIPTARLPGACTFRQSFITCCLPSRCFRWATPATCSWSCARRALEFRRPAHLCWDSYLTLRTRWSPGRQAISAIAFPAASLPLLATWFLPSYISSSDSRPQSWPFGWRWPFTDSSML